MALRMSFLAGPALLLSAACATAPAAPTIPATAAPTAVTAPASGATTVEVLVLRERVARLEKRLADVDARLGLLLARADGPARAPLRFDAPRGEQRAMDLSAVDDGALASIDIERGSGAGGSEAPAVPEVADDDGLAAGRDDDEPVVLRLRGAADDPLASLTSATALYDWAQTRLKESRHIEAIAAFEDVVGRFPKDALADNAQYWAAFCHQARGDHRLAVDAWQKLPLRFPRSDKIPDALFGMAVSHEALGEPALAEALYDEVVHSYSKAEKVKDARKALTRLRPPR